MDGIGGKVMVGQGDLKVSSNLNHSMILFLVWGLFFFFFFPLPLGKMSL